MGIAEEMLWKEFLGLGSSLRIEEQIIEAFKSKPRFL